MLFALFLISFASAHQVPVPKFDDSFLSYERNQDSYSFYDNSGDYYSNRYYDNSDYGFNNPMHYSSGFNNPSYSGSRYGYMNEPGIVDRVMNYNPNKINSRWNCYKFERTKSFGKPYRYC